ncbi:hypothetical protein V6N13_096850 [Hibiscus sabdariffa]
MLRGVPVVSMVDANGVWNWGLICSFLSQAILLHIVAIKDSAPTLGNECIGWRITPNNMFSVSSTYNLGVNQCDGWNYPSWKIISRFKGLEKKIKVSMWLVCQNRLMTNAERPRRHFMNDSRCQICQISIEDVDHVLRKCPQEVAISQYAIHPSMFQSFMEEDVSDWICANLHGDVQFYAIMTY